MTKFKPQILVDVLDHLKSDVWQDPEQVRVVEKVLQENVDMGLDLLFKRLGVGRHNQTRDVGKRHQDNCCRD